MVIHLYSDDNPATGRPRCDQLYLSQLPHPPGRRTCWRAVPGVGDVFKTFGAAATIQHARLARSRTSSRRAASRRATLIRRPPAPRTSRWRPAVLGQPPVPKPASTSSTPCSTLGRLTDPRAVRATSSSRPVRRRPRATRLRDVGPDRARRPGATATRRAASTAAPAGPTRSSTSCPAPNALATAGPRAAPPCAQPRQVELPPRACAMPPYYDPTPFIRRVGRRGDSRRPTSSPSALVTVVVYPAVPPGLGSALARSRSMAIPVSLVGTFACSRPLSASRSTTSRCSAWCWPSASWWTTPSSWSRTSSARAATGAARDAAHRDHGARWRAPVIAMALVLVAVFVPFAFTQRHHGPVLPSVRGYHRPSATVISAFSLL